MNKSSHRVTYNYSKIVPIRISIDRANQLTECPIEFEVLQELPTAPGAKDERLTLGMVRLNLSEYVEESENFPRQAAGSRNVRDKSGHSLTHRRLSSKSSAGAGGSVSPKSTNQSAQQAQHPEENDVVDEEAEEGIVRRYLMQDSKINSTLKIGILMVQVDGERNYVAPPLKTAPMFAGITGIMVGDQGSSEPVDEAGSGATRNPGPVTSLSKSRDVSEVQDMYRRALAASWACQPGELPADECIEDIFSGGDGWRHTNDGQSSTSASSRHGRSGAHSRSSHHLDGAADDESTNSTGNSNGDSGSNSPADDVARGGGAAGTLKPIEVPRIRHSRRQSAGSNHSDRSTRSGLTVLGEAREREARSRGAPPSPPFASFQQQQLLNHNLAAASRLNGGRLPPSREREREREYTMTHDPSAAFHGAFGLGAATGTGRGLRHRGSLATLGSTGSRSSSDRGGGDLDRGRSAYGAFGAFGGAFRRPKEIDEHEVREDLVAWKLPGTAAVS